MNTSTRASNLHPHVSDWISSGDIVTIIFVPDTEFDSQPDATNLTRDLAIQGTKVYGEYGGEEDFAVIGVALQGWSEAQFNHVLSGLTGFKSITWSSGKPHAVKA